MKIDINYVITGNNISVNYMGAHYMVSRSVEPKRYEALKEALKKDDKQAFIDALLPKRRVIKYSNSHFEIDDANVVRMLDRKDEALPKFMSARLVEFAFDELPIEPIVRFWKKLRENPDADAREMAYGFLERNGHPITPDGNFIAYKKVTGINGILVDSYTRSIRNMPGDIVAMPRDKVVRDKNVTCAAGLHVASWNYAQGYSGNTLLQVEVDPRDIVSVPVDYNGEKMRVCRYKVIGEIRGGERSETLAHVGQKCETPRQCESSRGALDLGKMSVSELLKRLDSDPAMRELYLSVRSMNPKNKARIVSAASEWLKRKGYAFCVSAVKSRKS